MVRTNTLLVKTPEGITFSLVLAGPIARFLAWIIDFFSVFAIMMVVNIVLQLFFVISPDVAQALQIVIYFVLSIGYSIFFEWRFKGQTPGKQLLRLRVMDVQGLRLQLSQIFIRNLLRFIDSLPFCYLIGGLAAIINRRYQRLGDIAANTIVVREPKITEPDLAQVLTHKYNSLRDYPHIVARLRKNTSPRMAHLALEALLRRDNLKDEARIALFEEFADHFKKTAAFPQEALEGIADEQFLRNVVEVLFVDKKPSSLG